MLQPVYSLNFVNGDLHKGLSEWYHPYQLVHLYHTNRVIEGLKIVFAEMEKYQNLPVKGNTKMDLWMRYFTEMTEKTRRPAPELLADSDIAKAIELLEIINYTEAEMEQYERYWDSVSVEATWKHIGHRDGLKEGMEVGMEKGMKMGMEMGMEKGFAKGRQQIVLNMFSNGFDISTIAKVTGLNEKEVRSLSDGVAGPDVRE